MIVSWYGPGGISVVVLGHRLDVELDVVPTLARSENSSGRMMSHSSSGCSWLGARRRRSVGILDRSHERCGACPPGVSVVGSSGRVEQVGATLLRVLTLDDHALGVIAGDQVGLGVGAEAYPQQPVGLRPLRVVSMSMTNASERRRPGRLPRPRRR